MRIQKVHIGGWFQRTTLHLSESWKFLKHGATSLDIDHAALSAAHAQLELVSVVREMGPLEYIYAESARGVSFRIYEDGLIILERAHSEINEDFNIIREYYDNRLSAALNLIFSKGAPVPKELATIATILPYIVTVKNAKKHEADTLLTQHGEEAYSFVSSKSVEVYRSPGIIIINNLEDEVAAREIIESQIFFREFKTQLHRYLDIHRALWEEIRVIKEAGEIRGTDVDTYRKQLAQYQKTITLISARIDQMPAYVRTRQKLMQTETEDAYLSPLFQFKFETLLDTHEYVRHLWAMTKNYLASAIELFTELGQKSTKNSIASLQVITTLGVVAAILGYLGRETLPTFTIVGAGYFILLLFITWLINEVVSRYYKHKSYPVDQDDLHAPTA
ncbi:MAG: hypothetical protein AAB573_04065 [Patescibacteria group bacterium]